MRLIRSEAPAEDNRQRILVVEDNDELREFICRSLSDQYTIASAVDGVQALKVLDNEGVVDLVISDVMMPRIDGLELCKRIKNDPAYSHIPVILLSAKVDQSVKIKGFEQGADVYIEKPFSMDQLKAQIGSAIENRMRAEGQFCPFAAAIPPGEPRRLRHPVPQQAERYDSLQPDQYRILDKRAG